MGDQPFSPDESLALSKLCDDWPGGYNHLETVSTAFDAACETYGDASTVILACSSYALLAEAQGQEPPGLEAFLWSLADEPDDLDPEDMRTAERYYAECISAAVRALRAGYGYKSSELAAMAGIAQSSLSRLETGEARDVKLSTVVALAMCFEMAPTDLFDFGARFL